MKEFELNVATAYHDRPDICRRFVAGSKKCKELRKERGIDR